jgi:myo-inositol-1(or 4)-monophosphatase
MVLTLNAPKINIMPIHDPHLDVMIDAAKSAGRDLLAHFCNRENLLVEYKNPGDLVSVADRQSEATIIALLDQHYPTYGILGEEGSSRPPSADGYHWIIDPLDATNNFLNGIPYWCVTLALAKHDTVVAGVTYDPVHDELFYVVAGQGAFCNNKPIKTNNKNLVKHAAASLDIGAPPHPLMDRYTQAMTQSLTHCATAMTQRCCALSLAYLAAGRLDLFLHFGRVNPWDMAAGWLLVQEAGGIITDINKNPLHLESGTLRCAANSTLYDAYGSLLSH